MTRLIKQGAHRTLQALKLVKQGISHPLGIVVGPTTPAYPPRSISLQVVSPGQHNGRSLEGDFGWNITYNDDLAQIWFGIGSQIDGFGHLGEGGMYYNCNHARDFVNVSGLNKLGTHNIPPIVARGVVVDMARHKGVDALAGGQPISSADIQPAAAAQGVEFREGDVILIHTGRLAREGVHEFLFVLGQARIKGTVQMIINPVAMW